MLDKLIATANCFFLHGMRCRLTSTCNNVWIQWCAEPDWLDKRNLPDFSPEPCADIHKSDHIFFVDFFGVQSCPSDSESRFRPHLGRITYYEVSESVTVSPNSPIWILCWPSLCMTRNKCAVNPSRRIADPWYVLECPSTKPIPE